MTFRRGCCIRVGFGTQETVQAKDRSLEIIFLVRTMLMGTGQTLVRWMKSKEAKDGESQGS